ncbi:MAG: hypothetical protein ACRENE_16370 [Polyangiaceae bacterium]
MAASLRRLRWASAPTGLAHGALVAGLGGSRGAEARTRLAAALDRYGEGRGQWERGLLLAAADPDDPARAARINEKLTELEVLAERWDGVPRVSARLTSSVGFLCATVALLQGLSPSEDAEPGSLHAALWTAVGALVAGVVGTALCGAVHVRAKAARTAAVAAADRLVQGLTGVAADD